MTAISPSISVIVCAAVNREENLTFCLKSLAQQTYPHFEVIVVNDGSSLSLDVLEFPSLTLQYQGRPQDFCVSRSRNLGAQQAQGQLLVFIDSDILLNPCALSYYHANFRDNSSSMAIYGCMGGGQQMAPSSFFPQRMVNWSDSRFPISQSGHLKPHFKILKYPHASAWSGNFAIRKSDYLKVGGFDENYKGWGDEDLEFASRLINQKIQVHFSVEAWCEHQTHSRQEAFHTMEKGPRFELLFQEVTYPVLIYRNPKELQTLHQAIYNHYLPHSLQGLNRTRECDPSPRPLDLI